MTHHRHENETRRWTAVAERRGRTDLRAWAEGEPHPERIKQSRHADWAPVRQKVVVTGELLSQRCCWPVLK